jgi:hypothetical protein
MSDTVIETYADADTLVAAAGDRLVLAIVAAIAKRDAAYVVVTGGGTGVKLLKHLGDHDDAIDWAFTLACTLPFGPMVRLLSSSTIVPSTSPSINKSSLPVISPFMCSDLPICAVDRMPLAEDTAAGERNAGGAAGAPGPGAPPSAGNRGACAG